MARSWITIITILAALLLTTPAHATVQEIRVMAVGVDSSPNAATQKALDYARKRAVFLVMQKMRVEDAHMKAAMLTEKQLGRIIRGATIEQTRQMEGRIYADVTVSVLDTVLLEELGLDVPNDGADKAIPMRGVLVLPVAVVKDRPYVWEKENTLRTPMRSEVLRLSHGSVVVPTGDFDDLRLVDHNNVLTVKGSNLKPMFERYGAEEIIIAVIPQDHLEAEVSVLLRRLTMEGIRQETITLPAATTEESADDRRNELVMAVASAATQIAASTSQQQQEALASAPHIPVTFHFGNVREIGKMQETIRHTPGVLQLRVPTIGLNKVQGVLYLSADKEVVKKALIKNGILIADDAGGWQVSLR